jgi:hypothetical protein
MKHLILCDPYFWESPFVLFQTGLLFSTNTVCLSEHINHIFIHFLILSLISYISVKYYNKMTPVYIAVMLFIIFTLYSLMEVYRIKTATESFVDRGTTQAEPQPSVALSADRIQSSMVTYPTARNPFMNVLADEVRYNPGRPPAASVLDPSVKISLDDFFRTEFARDPTDVFGRSQSQREFITMPSTSIPNDIESYQNWLYKIPGKTCKEGGRESCIPGTDGYIPWMNSN